MGKIAPVDPTYCKEVFVFCFVSCRNNLCLNGVDFKASANLADNVCDSGSNVLETGKEKDLSKRESFVV